MRNKLKLPRIIMALALVAIVALGAMIPARAGTPIRVTIDGIFVHFEDAEPQLVEGRVLVPVRGAFEHMGFFVDWISETRTATLENEAFFIQIPADGTTFLVNGEIVTPDVPQQTVGGRLMLPLRAVAEAVGGTANWDSVNRIAIITTPGQDVIPAPPQVQPPASEPDNEPDPEPESEPEPSPVAARETPFLYTRSAITITNRRLSAVERQEWIDEYNANGGASAFELEVVRLVNEERENYGLNPLEICHTLMLAARFYAQTMANLNTNLGHREGPYGGSFETADAFGDRMVGVRAANGTGGRWTPESAVQGWMDSPGHRQNILNPNITRMGTGFHLGGQWGVFGYQLFGGGAATPVPNN